MAESHPLTLASFRAVLDELGEQIRRPFFVLRACSTEPASRQREKELTITDFSVNDQGSRKRRRAPLLLAIDALDLKKRIIHLP